ncbi:MAG: zinc ribbon domain-containing protein [candidate division WS1 bacterium]|nr:zinc ribbon domain-containing protein [candidate division WS1 bacterium]
MAVKYCTVCGFANSQQRGACLMCYNPLREPTPPTVACPNPECGRDNDRKASFCTFCGTAIAEGVTAVPDSLAMAIAILDEAAGHRGSRDDRIGPADDYADDEPEMDEEQAAAFEQFKADQAAMRGDIDMEPAEEPEEEYVPPSALTLEQQTMSADAAPEFEEEELLPPPPPEEEPALSMGDLSMDLPEPPQVPEAPTATADLESVPPVPDELGEEDLIPPMPVDLIGPAEDETPADTEPEAEPAVAEEAEPAVTEETEFEEEGLGGWSLTFDDDSQEDE